MSNLEELIEQLCPDGVEFRELGEICEFMNGKGHEKHIIENGKYIVVNSKFVSTGGNVKKYSDQQISPIFINDILMVMSDLPKGKALAKCFVVDKNDKFTLNQRIGAFTVKDRSKTDSMFLYYILNRNKQLLRFDNGADQTNLRKDDILKISIPNPPLPIQQEIVTILNTFTQLQAELEAELQARRTQYEYYRNELLNFEGKEVEWKMLGEIGEFIRGRRFVKNDIVAEGVPCIHYGEMYTYYKIWARKSKSFLEPALAAKLRVAHPGDVIIVAAGETVEDIGNGVAWLGESDVVIHDACFAFRHQLNPKYVSYYMQTNLFRSQIKRYISSGKISSINAPGLSKALIPIPPPAEQERIVAILDKFEALVNDKTEGLPAEIQARRKQYEYYRGKLLDFKPLAQ